MVRRVRQYLSMMPTCEDEEKLAEMSQACEPPARKREASPGVQGGSPSLEERRGTHPLGPKFG